MQSRVKRGIVLLMCAVFMLTLLFSSVYIVRAANHVCAGECCLVCSIIARVEAMLHGIVILIAAVLALSLAAAEQAYGAVCEKRLAAACRTLVNWKIRLND